MTVWLHKERPEIVKVVIFYYQSCMSETPKLDFDITIAIGHILSELNL